MRIKIITTMKNEDDLLRPWIKYHAHLVGPENLIVFDNGSTSSKVLRIIDWARRSGVAIDQSQSSQDDFLKREDRYTALIKQIDKRKGADFYFPMDCDEFLAVKRGERLAIGRDVLLQEIAKYRKSEHPLKVLASVDNNPLYPGYFRWVTTFEKHFFAAGACEWLGGGFHDARSKSGAPALLTDIVYVHFQMKPYDALLEHSKTKLRPWLDDFSREGLQAHVDRGGVAYHCAEHMLRSREEYEHLLGLFHAVEIGFPEVEAAFHAVGEALPFSNPDAPDADDGPPLQRTKRSSWRALKALFAPHHA